MNAEEAREIIDNRTSELIPTKGSEIWEAQGYLACLDGEEVGTLVDLLRRNLERMNLINGPDEKCVLTLSQCKNHRLINETEAILKDYTSPTPTSEKGEV